MKDYKLIVFDWDGTLMDSAQKIVDCMQVAIEKTGLPQRSDAQIRHIIGLGMHEAVEHLFPQQNIDVKRLVAEYRDEFVAINQTQSPLYDGVTEMLDALEARGYWIAVATGKSRSGLNHVLADIGMQQRFHSTKTADETASKPDPLMLQELMAECGYAAEQLLMIGDTEFDIQMAHAAGVDVLAVKGGAHPEEHLRKFSPLAVLDTVADLLDFLKIQ